MRRTTALAACLVLVAFAVTACGTGGRANTRGPSHRAAESSNARNDSGYAFSSSWDAAYPMIPASVPASEAARLALRSAVSDLRVSRDRRVSVVRLIPYATIPTGGPVAGWSSFKPTGNYVVLIVSQKGELASFSMGVSGTNWKLTRYTPLQDGRNLWVAVSDIESSLVAVRLAYEGGGVTWVARRDGAGRETAIPSDFVWDHWNPQLAGKPLRPDGVYPLQALLGPITPGPQR